MLKNGHPGLAGHGARQQRLARAGRPDQEHAAWDPRPERVELLGVFQELHDLLQLGLGLVDARHVRERDDGRWGSYRRAFEPPKPSRPCPLFSMLRPEYHTNPMSRRNGSTLKSRGARKPPALVVSSAVTDTCFASSRGSSSGSFVGGMTVVKDE